MVRNRKRTARRPLAALFVFLAVLRHPAPAGAASDIWFDDTLVASLKVGLICSLHSQGSLAAPETELGSITRIGQPPEIVWQGTRIPAVMGLAFGVVAQAIGPEPIADLRLTIRHPPFLGTGTNRQAWAMDILPGVATGNVYSFDFPHELVTGTWTFESRAPDGALIYRVAFQVVPPEAAPLQAQLCDGDVLISRGAEALSPAAGPA